MAKLKIYTDENVDIRVSEGLKRRGIKSFTAIDKSMIGASDLEHFRFTTDAKSAIFTHDHHFIQIALETIKKNGIHYGVIFIEMNKLSVGECVKRLALYAEVLTAEEMINQIEFL